MVEGFQHVDGLPVAWIMHAKGQVRAANKAAHQLFDVPCDEDVRGLTMFDFVHPDSQEPLAERLRMLHETGRPTNVAVARMRRRDGSDFWVESLANLTEFESEPVVQVLCWDVTDRVRTEARLAHAALHDPLTGLANRSLLEQRWAVAVSGDAPGRPALLFCDVNDFKGVNDAHGHLAGDQVLRVLADRLTHSVRPDDTVARVGGDEFVVLVASAERPAVLALADRIRHALVEDIRLDTALLRVDVAVGVAFAEPGDERFEVVLRRADLAMYGCKRWVHPADPA